MSKTLLLAVLAAVLSGLAIGLQASLNGATGRNLGAVFTGLLVNVAGGAAAGLLLTFVLARQGGLSPASLTAPTLIQIVVSGLLGIGIIAGVSYALPKTGVAAGLSALIAGQMLVALVVDTFGLAGGPPIPVTLGRVAGLGLLALGTWALLPKG